MDRDGKVSASGKRAPLGTVTRRRFYVSDAFAEYFPAHEFSYYRDFFGLPGETLKQERRTHVVLVRRTVMDEADKHACLFVVKCHRYPILPRLRTGFRISKAENEFKSLLYLRSAGVPAVEPVAFGVERTAAGLVRSCFIVTRYLEAAVNLADWQWHHAGLYADRATRRAVHLRRLGAIFQRLHRARFFLFTAKTKNILLSPIADVDPEMHLIDTPYARTLHWLPLARWAQGRDLGYCLGSFYPAVTAEDLKSFYEGYLPDALGDSDEQLQRRVLHAICVQQNITPLARSVNTVKDYLRRRRRARRLRFAQR